MNHLLKELRVLKHRARTQMVVVEWLTVMISHKQRALENLKDGILMNVCVGEMDEYNLYLSFLVWNIDTTNYNRLLNYSFWLKKK
mgnify:CR=1 FL=1